jgi:ubiquinone/menaquinone biosynthesis C-methylase UbiE/superfamily II DNA or RNA helicase
MPNNIEKSALELALEDAYLSALKVVDFGESLWNKGPGVLKPRMHQIIRIHEAVRNGKKRILCADATAAGKTFTAVAIKGLLDEDYMSQKGRKAKALVIAPNQAIESAWSSDEINKYAQALVFPAQNSIHIEKGNYDKLLRNDFILVNYDKLSIADSFAKPNEYLQNIVGILPDIDLIIVDECHNLKNINSNRSKAFRELVEKSVNKNFVMLSASPIPNRLKDAGFLLYMLDPQHYKFYSENEFDYSEDSFSIMNAMNSGAWFSFSRDDVKNLFSLPELRFGAPELGIESQHRFEMSTEAVQEYFEEWKSDSNIIGKIASLSQILLKHEIDEIEKICRKITDAQPNAQIGIYSFYKEGFSENLRQRLSQTYNDKVAVITGDVELKDRLQLAEKFRQGELKIAVNTISTVSESISLVTGENPCYVIFAEPPIVPANFDQAIGRFYRLNQEAPVTVVEIVPCSEKLNALQIEETMKRKGQGVRYRSSWTPGTIFEDKPKIRKQKQEEIIEKVGKGAIIEGHLLQIANAAEGSEDGRVYPTMPEPDKAKGNTNNDFNEGLKAVRRCIGLPIDTLVNSEARKYLVESYSMDNWEQTSSADTNKAIMSVLNSIENSSGKNLDSILDWGCGTACLARTIRRKIHNLDAIDEMLAVGKEKTKDIYGEDSDSYFHLGDAKQMPFDDKSFDLVSSSYALQYNCQGDKHKRDIEKILLETNRVLKRGGYGIFALPNQATTPEDIDSLGNMLGKYGFQVLLSDFVTGHAVNPETEQENKVFRGFYIILYNKQEDVAEFTEQDDFFVYSNYKKLGIGGIRNTCYQNKQAAGYKSAQVPAEIFKLADKSLLDEKITEIIGGKNEN